MDCSLTIVPAVASVLSRVLGCGIMAPTNGSGAAPTTPFDTSSAAKAIFTSTKQLMDFVDLICRRLDCTASCLIVAMIYLDRITKSGFVFLTARNVQSLLLLSILTAKKWMEDVQSNTADFALVGGLPTSELNRLEILYLFYIQFELHVQPNEWKLMRNKLKDCACTLHVPPAMPFFQSSCSPTTSSFTAIQPFSFSPASQPQSQPPCTDPNTPTTPFTFTTKTLTNLSSSVVVVRPPASSLAAHHHPPNGCRRQCRSTEPFCDPVLLQHRAMLMAMKVNAQN